MRHDRNLDSLHQALDPLGRDLLESGLQHGSTMNRFLMGAVAGAAVALLFAPQAGRDSRAWIKDNSRRLRDGAGDRLGTVKHALHDGAEVVRESVAAGKTAYRSAREETRAGSYGA
jgi:gas vesicle protein